MNDGSTERSREDVQASEEKSQYASKGLLFRRGRENFTWGLIKISYKLQTSWFFRRKWMRARILGLHDGTGWLHQNWSDFISVKQAIQQSNPSVCSVAMEREMAEAVHGAQLGSYTLF